MAGTASRCQRWVLLEHAAAWGPRMLLDSGFEEPVAVALREWALRNDVRLVLIKQPERVDEEARSVFLVAAGETERSVERLEVGRPSDLLELELGREPSGWGIGREWTEPIYLVCTHGRRDPCCAIQGNPIFNVLHEAFPTQLWKSTHVGGDRFAANLVSLPTGVMLGRLQLETAINVVTRLDRGEIDLQHYRGRSCYPFHVQAAEHHLRLDKRIEDVDAVRLIDHERKDSFTTAEFETGDGDRHRVTIETRRAAEARPLTCHSAEPARPPEYVLISIS